MSQTGLDKSIVDTVNVLNNTKIDVITDVIEQLDDDGLPDVAQTTLVKNNLSVLNFFTPTVHEWKNVSISMDLEIGALDNESGITFHQHQWSEHTRAVGLFWGFLFISQGKVTEKIVSGVVTERSVDVLITVRKKNGDVNPNVSLSLDAAGPTERRPLRLSGRGRHEGAAVGRPPGNGFYPIRTRRPATGRMKWAPDRIPAPR